MFQKDLEAEFKHLATEFRDFLASTEKLFKKYEILENKYGKCFENKANARFTCNICEQECENIKDLQEHKREQRSMDGEFQCDECDKSFNSKNQLEKHEKMHETFECEKCDKIFYYEGLLETHTEAVHPDSIIQLSSTPQIEDRFSLSLYSFIYEFQNKKPFMSQKGMDEEFKHLATEFKEIKVLTGKLFKKYEILENTLENYLRSRAIDKSICRICKKECQDVKGLQEQKREQHYLDGEFKCDECEKLFNSEKQLEKHEEMHETFECENCDKIFFHRGLLEIHTEADHSGPDSNISSFQHLKLTGFQFLCAIFNVNSKI